MSNNSREVEEYLKTRSFRKKRKQEESFIDTKEKNIKITADERDTVLNKVRQFLETGKGERLNKEEEEILKEMAGVCFSAYKKAIEILDNRELGGIENER